MKKADETMIEVLKADNMPILESLCNMIDRYNNMVGCQSVRTNVNRMLADLDRIVDKVGQKEDGY